MKTSKPSSGSDHHRLFLFELHYLFRCNESVKILLVSLPAYFGDSSAVVLRLFVDCCPILRNLFSQLLK
jgi:hypothetical protein